MFYQTHDLFVRGLYYVAFYWSDLYTHLNCKYQKTVLQMHFSIVTIVLLM